MNIKLVLFLVFAACTVYSQKSYGDESTNALRIAKNFLPLSEGNAWTYRKVMRPGRNPYYYHILGRRIGKDVFALFRQHPVPEEQPLTIKETYAIADKLNDHTWRVNVTITPSHYGIGAIRDGRYTNAKEILWEIVPEMSENAFAFLYEQLHFGMNTYPWSQHKELLAQERRPLYLFWKQLAESGYTPLRNVSSFTWPNASLEITYSNGLAPVMIEGGFFPNCIEVIEDVLFFTGIDKNKPYETGWKTVSSYAVGVGLVKEIQKDQNGNVLYDTELVRYDVFQPFASGGLPRFIEESAEKEQIIEPVIEKKEEPKEKLEEQKNDSLPAEVAEEVTGEEKIYFSSNRNGDREIYSVHPDGSGETNLTRYSAHDTSPSPSPDGKRIVFASDRDGDYELYVMRSTGSGIKRLTHHSGRDGFPSWSPDGKQIAFASNRDGDFDVYIMDADGNGQRKISDDPAIDIAPSWSHDGGKIVFCSYRDGNAELYIMNADGKDIRNLTNNRATDTDPSFSPDGTRIAFASDRTGNSEIYIMNTDGTDAKRITFHGATDADPNWSHDGNSLLFTSNRDGKKNIYAIGIDGSGIRPLSTKPSNDCPCSAFTRSSVP